MSVEQKIIIRNRKTISRRAVQPVSVSGSNFVFVVDEPEEVFETNWELEVNKFDDMGLKESVLRGIYGYGFKDPSPIQQKGILPVI